MYSDPLAYFISFRTYGTWLHGDDRGSVDPLHNTFDTPLLPTNARLEKWEADTLKHPPVMLDDPMRRVVDRTIREVCQHKGWALLAVNVRTNHVHTVVRAGGPPEPVMNAFKAWATRRVVEAGLTARGTRVWSRHGSTVYLFREEKVDEKCMYVLECQ